MMSYFKKHFVTRVRNFVFTYRKSIERKCHTTDRMTITITITIIIIKNTEFFRKKLLLVVRKFAIVS